MRRSHRLLAALWLVLLAACGQAAAPAATVVPAAANPTAALATPPPAGAAIDPANWEAVLAAAKGQTVNWYMWGGSDSINSFVDTFYGKPLQATYGITLKRVPVADTVDVVNQLLSEKQAGAATSTVDLIWINGENFKSLKQADLLLKGWARKLPNSQFVNWDNPAINLDFGEPVAEMESPWSSAQFQLVYDTARTPEAELPRSYADLKTWACAHQGRFTYIAPGPGAFQGTRFVKQALFELSGGADQWLGPFNQQLWDQWSPKLWAYFNELKPCLWRGGETYPKDENELRTLFANQEVDFTITQAIAGAEPMIAEKTVPPTSRAYVFNDNMIGDFNYVAIPSTAPNQAAALVLANLILDPELQAAQIVPANGFGLGYGIDVSNVADPAAVAKLQAASQALGPGATDPKALAASLVSDVVAEYQDRIEQDWQKNVLGK